MAQKSFKFRLQTILDYKQDIEDKEKEKLAKIIAELAKAIEYKRMLEQRREQAKVELKEKQKAGLLNIAELQFYTGYLKKLDKDILEAALFIEQIKQKEREQRAELLRAAQQRQIYEKLKEKHKEEYDAEEAEIDRKLIDELGTIKAARRLLEENAQKEDLELGFITEDELD